MSRDPSGREEDEVGDAGRVAEGEGEGEVSAERVADELGGGDLLDGEKFEEGFEEEDFSLGEETGSRRRMQGEGESGEGERGMESATADRN